MQVLHLVTLLTGVSCVYSDDSDDPVISNLEIPLPVEDVKLDLKHRITKDHVLEELQHRINTKQKTDMSQRELQFHYFKLHDYDNNNLLDGLEIVKALKHEHDDKEEEEENEDEHGFDQTEEGIIELVDGILLSDDHNKDGYISFYELTSGQGDV